MRAAAQHIDAGSTETLDVLGPTIEVLTPPGVHDDAPVVLRGTIPPGGRVPIHSHDDPETFFAVSGELEGLREGDDGFEWVVIRPGDVFVVPGGVKHAFRNSGDEPAVSIQLTTSRLARFFRDISKPATPGAMPEPPCPETLARFFAISERYGYWNGGPEDNADVGIDLPDYPERRNARTASTRR
jgi:quercetin dioxygenase-like cupin family protein